jgi:hypothetical protein
MVVALVTVPVGVTGGFGLLTTLGATAGLWVVALGVFVVLLRLPREVKTTPPGATLELPRRLHRAFVVAASAFLIAAPDSSALQVYEASLRPDHHTPRPHAQALAVAGGWRRLAAESLRLIGFLFLVVFALGLIYAPQLLHHPEIPLSAFVRRLPDWRVSVSVAFVLAGLMCSGCCQLASRIDGDR